MADDRRRTDRDLLRNVKFVKLLEVHDLRRAEAIQQILRENRVGAVIINDEAYQARDERQRAAAVPGPGGFRIEVPEPALETAREVLQAIEHAEEEE